MPRRLVAGIVCLVVIAAGSLSGGAGDAAFAQGTPVVGIPSVPQLEAGLRALPEPGLVLAVIEAVPALKERYDIQDRLQRGFMLQTYKNYPWANLLRDLSPTDEALVAQKLREAQERRLPPSPVPWR